MRMTAPASPSALDEAAEGDQEGRIEKWIVSNLENDGEARASGRKADDPWTRFRVARRGEITVVKLLDTSLVRDTLLAELDDQLSVLIDAGSRRIVLDFARVERLSCHLIVSLARAYRRCAETAGGMLRICRLGPEVAEILAIAGLVPQVENFPDEKTAVEAPWPGPAVILPLPVSILSVLSSRQALGSEEGRSRHVAKGAGRAAVPAGWKLIVEGGKSAGRVIPIDRPRLTIGREPGCDLRFNSPSVSRLHARIEVRGDRVILRDLGSTNGTVVNGRLLKDQEATLAPADLIEIGGARFLVALDAASPDDQIVGWLADEDEADGRGSEETMTMKAYEGRAAAKARAFDLGLSDDKIKCEVIEDVLILTPMTGHLDDDSTIDPLRKALLKILEGPLPSRLVLNLAYVGHLSSLAIGVLVAHHLRLQRSGGAMRFCLAQPLVLSYLTLIRLPMLVECYPTMDDAVLTSW